MAEIVGDEASWRLDFFEGRSSKTIFIAVVIVADLIRLVINKIRELITVCW